MPPRDPVLQAQLHPSPRGSAVSFWKHPCRLSADPHGWIIAIFFCRCPEGSTSHASRKGLFFPKLFGTESPEDETGEIRPRSVMAPLVPSTPARTASIIALLLDCLGLPWFGFGTCSQSLAAAWAWWGHRCVSLRPPAASLFTVCDLEGGELHLALSRDCTCNLCDCGPSLICKVLVLHFLHCSQQGHTLGPSSFVYLGVH